MKLWKMVLGFILAVMATSFAYTQNIDRGTFIGITMPESTKRFFNDDDVFQAEAKKRSFNIEIQYANDRSQQNQQILNFLNKGAKVLIVSCIDNDYIFPVITRATQAGVLVIAYDRFITNANYTVTANHFGVGIFQAQSIVKALNLEKTKSSAPKYITLFAGSPSDIASHRFYDGAMGVLNTYIDRGVLKVVGPYPRSSADLVNFRKIATDNWQPSFAKNHMKDILTSDASNITLDAILSPNDGISLAIIEACKTDSKYKSFLPVICGLDGSFNSAMSFKNGEQYSTVFFDTSKYAEAAIILAEQILQGKTPNIPGAVLAAGEFAIEYDDGTKLENVYLVDPVLVTKKNLSILIQSGRYSSDEVKRLSK